MELWFFKRSIKFCCFVLGLCLLPSYKIKPDHRARLIIWNVGQGQWVTYSTSHRCLHIDIGGEKFDNKKIFEECQDKINSVELTHADWDHISFLSWARKKWPDLCVGNPPREKLDEKKSQLISQTPKCAKNQFEDKEYFLRPPENFKNANDLSRVYFLNFAKALVPGDSSKRAEKIWASKNILAHILILGHHGSRTSSSDFLLNHLPKLKMTIASQRQKKYGHPHKDVVERIKNKNVPLLTTESWGNIRIEL